MGGQTRGRPPPGEAAVDADGIAGTALVGVHPEGAVSDVGLAEAETERS